MRVSGSSGPQEIAMRNFRIASALLLLIFPVLAQQSQTLPKSAFRHSANAGFPLFGSSSHMRMYRNWLNIIVHSKGQFQS
jgi:hypothetical protein